MHGVGVLTRYTQIDEDGLEKERPSDEVVMADGVLAIIVTGTDAGDEAGFAINKCVDDDLVTDEAYCFGHEGGTKGVHEMTHRADHRDATRS